MLSYMPNQSVNSPLGTIPYFVNRKGYVASLAFCTCHMCHLIRYTTNMIDLSATVVSGSIPTLI